MAQQVGAQGQVNIVKNTPTCDVPPENPPPKTKIFFSILTTRLAESVDGLNSSLDQSPGELQDCKALHETWFSRDGDVVFTSVRTPFFKLLSAERNLFPANIQTLKCYRVYISPTRQVSLAFILIESFVMSQRKSLRGQVLRNIFFALLPVIRELFLVKAMANFERA